VRRNEEEWRPERQAASYPLSSLVDSERWSPEVGESESIYTTTRRVESQKFPDALVRVVPPILAETIIVSFSKFNLFSNSNWPSAAHVSVRARRILHSVWGSVYCNARTRSSKFNHFYLTKGRGSISRTLTLTLTLTLSSSLIRQHNSLSAMEL
jgi:hypothetical protein